MFQKMGHRTYSAIGSGTLELTPQVKNTLSRLNTGEHFKGKADPKIVKALLDNFDVLYVSQIPGWLLAYAPAFLKAGKKVAFRVYGGNIAQWGWTPRPILKLLKDPNFSMVCGWPGEFEMWGRELKNCFAYLDPKVYNPEGLKPQWRPFALTTMSDWHIFCPQLAKLQPQWRFKKGHLSHPEYVRLMMKPSLYVDTLVHPYVTRYSPAEAMISGIPAIFPRKGAFFKMMKTEGFKGEGLTWAYADFAELQRLISHYVNNTVDAQTLGKLQKKHFLKKMDHTRKVWSSIL